MAVITMRRGDTFEAPATVTATEAGVPVTDFTGYSFTSMVAATDGSYSDTLVVTANDTAGNVTLSRVDTTAWPVGMIAGDILVVSPSGTKTHTAPFYIEVSEGYTNAET
jgi:hypothetical protein